MTKKMMKKTTKTAAGRTPRRVAKASSAKTKNSKVSKATKTKEVKTKRAAVKKVTKKEPIKKLTIRRVRLKKKTPLVISSQETAFYAINGAVIYSLLDLYEELQTMLDEEFSFHSDPESNHFSNWMGDILQDEDCAEEFKKANTRRKARMVIKKHLEKYSY